MRTKICGITNIDDALIAVEAGANALGFVFYKKSPRYIEPKKVREIVKSLPPFIQIVGLFVNENDDFINNVCSEALIDMAQIYDDNLSLNYGNLKYKYTKVVRAKSRDDILKNKDKYVLIDAFVEEFGGAGKRVALEWFKDIDCSTFILAGGLNENNLKELKGYNFFGVDVSSGVEVEKGKKDKQKIFDFIKIANEI